jgi:hypothetical protein
MAFQITKEWLIDLSGDFENRVEDDKIIFWKTGVTVVVAAFSVPQEIGKIDLLNQIQKKIPENSLETLVSTKGEIVGLGYTQIHKALDEKKRLSLYTFTSSDTSCLQTAFYLDNPDDLSWAKSVWESILFHPDRANQA